MPRRRATRSTIGRAGPVRSAASVALTWQSARAAARSRTMIANGLAQRRFRSRSRATADASVASQAR